MRSPFKFLDSYERKDREIFFGREKETAALYELVNQNRLVLLYGSSGTGKTSLIQCGLGNRFPATDWYPLFVRRGHDLNESLRKVLEDALGEPIEGSLSEAIEDLYAEYLRPVYLIFDQFEEIFVLGDEAEQAAFIQDIAALNAAKLPCQIIFSLREEYLAHLYPFEQVIPTLLDRRLRVETMNFLKAAEVIQASCSAFNIELEEPDANARQIIDKVSAGRSGISLPYLQVYLDRLYLDDIQRTYGANIPEEPLPALEFTAEEIDSMGDIGDVLKIFLQEQRQRIQQELLQKYPDSPDQAVRKILNGFASLEGTKIPLDREEIRLAGLRDAGLSYVLGELEQSRILREEDGTYELAHDTLSLRISEQRSAADIALLEAADLVQGRMRAFERTSAYLNVKELQLIENYAIQLKEEEKLKPEAWDFVKESQQHVKREENRRKLITGGVITVLVAFLAFAGWQWWQADKSAEAAKQSEQAAKEHEQEALAEKDKADSLLIVSEDALTAAEESNKAALAEKAKADQALEEMKLAQVGIIDREMDKKDRAIREEGNMDLAYEIVKEAIALQTPTESLREGILELALYYNTLRNGERRDSLLSHIPGFRKNRPLSRSAPNDWQERRKEIQGLAGRELFTKIEGVFFPEMVKVEGGTFEMGDKKDDYTVELSAYEIGKYEVTFAQYDLFCKVTQKGKPSDENWGRGSRPVINVSWHDAAYYANWLSKLKGLDTAYIYSSGRLESINYLANGYRLPIEAEWEFAARGGLKMRETMYAGSNDLDSVGWYTSNSNRQTHPVGSKRANELGIYDMSGNVWEWCGDRNGSYPKELESNPRGPKSGEGRVLRGGSWDGSAEYLLVSYRDLYGPNFRSNLYGFRIARTLSF